MTNQQAENEIVEYMTRLEDSNKKTGYYLYILHKNNDGSTSLIDISTLAGDIQHYTSLTGDPGKFTFFIQKDPKGILSNVKNGDMVIFDWFGDNGKGVGIFKGFIFTIGLDATNVFKITAYDQLRYLKNEDTVRISKMTVSQIFQKFCVENNLKYKITTPVNFVRPPKLYHGKTIYSILNECLMMAENESAKQGRENSIKYMIRDNYGVLELISLDKLLTNVEIGVGNILSSYQFETSIDQKTYTRVKIEKKISEENSITNVFTPSDKNIENTWGILQKVIQVDDKTSKAQAEEMAKQYLNLTCRETKSLKLSALGIMGFNAGVGFKFNVPDLGAKLNMYILEATHKYTDSFHTMDLTVNANDVEIPAK